MEVAFIKSLKEHLEKGPKEQGIPEQGTQEQGGTSLRNHLRQAGLAHLKSVGFPLKTHEDWRYLNLKPLLQTDWKWQSTGVAFGSTGDKSSEKSFVGELKEFEMPDSYRLVFVNGNLDLSHSTDLVVLQNAGLQIKWTHLEEQAAVLEESSTAELSQSSLGSESGLSKMKINPRIDGFSLLNEICFNQQIDLEIAEGAVLDKTLHLLFLSPGESKMMSHPRVNGRIHTGAKASVFLQVASMNQSDDEFVNYSDRWRLEEGAQLRLVHLQNLNKVSFGIGKTQFYLHKNSQLDSLAVSAGGQLCRHQLDSQISGSGVDLKMNGLCLVEGEQISDFHTLIHHEIGGSRSSQLYKSILKDRGVSIFNGKVRIDPNAQEAESAQLNKNLLLSRMAEANSKPEMDIQADNVVATHGATFGRISEEELFYLQSRAISKDKAVGMMTRGFASEVVLALSDQSVIFYLEKQIAKFNGHVSISEQRKEMKSGSVHDGK